MRQSPGKDSSRAMSKTSVCRRRVQVDMWTGKAGGSGRCVAEVVQRWKEVGGREKKSTVLGGGGIYGKLKQVQPFTVFLNT